MKRIIYTFLLGLACVFPAIGQPYDLTLSSPESGAQLHQATNSITLSPGYSYISNSSTMLSEIVNPYVTDSIVNYQSNVDPVSRPLNTSSYLVGATKGAFNVNPAGGASYTIPIDVLPGVNGLAPSLSLVYSSNSGPGVAGYGWQIGGISVVSRSPQNYYNDGAMTGIDLSSSDKFSIDGQRLVLTSGIYGAHLATYQTEIVGFTRVQSQYTSGDGPEKFMAQTKSGLENLYGFTDDGCQRINDYSEVLNWYITETYDLYGNLISYKYMRNNGAIYPAEINYGPNKITFNYKERSDVTTLYLKGQKIEQRMLLDKITVAYNSNIVKTYELKYNLISDNYNNYSVLNEVVKYGTGGSRLNSTAFSYQVPTNVAIAQSINNTSNDFISYKSKLYTGDFNGDGKADCLCLPDVSKGATWTGWKMYLGDGNDYFSLSSSGSGDYNFIGAADLNGDGKEDLIMSWYWSDGYSTTERFESWISNGISFTATNYFAEKEVSFGYYSGSYAFGYDNGSADFNGDGLADFLIYRESGYWEIYSYSYSNGTLNNISLQFSGTVSSLNDKVFYGDFNGDGKSDIWNIDSNGTKIYSLNGSSLTQIYTSTWPTKDHFFTLGDFNADGKTDMFLYGWTTYDWGDWQVLLSTGTDFETMYIPKKKSNLKDDIVRTGDFNGDGCTDLMVTASTDNGWSGHYYFISKNKGIDFYSYFLQESLAPSYNYFLEDFNGDGRTDYLCTDGVPSWLNGYMIYRQTGYKYIAPLLEKVANGLNHLTTIAYTKLSQASSSVYYQGTNPSFPVFNFQGAMPVVSSATMDNGIGGTNSLSYYYEGAKIHRQGKGFLGFSKMKVTDATAGIVNETLSAYNTTYFSPLSNTVTKKATNGTTIETDDTTLETATSTYSQTVLDATTKRIFPYVQSSTQTNVLTNQSVTTTVSGYDNYGNPGTINKAFKTANTDEGSQTVAYQYLSENVTNWLLGRPTKATTTYTKGTESITQVVNREYSTTTNRDTAEVWYPGTDKQIRYSHVFYSNGNLKKEMATSGGVSRSTSYAYNGDNVRVYTKTDTLGHITTYSYDTSNGRMLTETDFLNNVSTYTYDNLGRVLTNTQSDGFVTTNTYNWGINTFTNSIYNLTTSGNDGSETKTWYDKLGRAIRSDVKGFDGQYIYNVTNYTGAGQLQQVSEPSTSASPSQWSKYYYWPEGRLQKIERHTGSITNYSYSGITATENTDGKIRYKETDSQGLLTKAHDAGGDILYAYYPDGKVKTITTPGNAVTTMEYNDAARNQTKLDDPSAGTIQYTYDGFGQLKSETDAKNQATNYNYKTNGLLETKDSPYETITYSYYANNTLSGIGNTKTNYTYSVGYEYCPDNEANRGKVKKITETIPGSTAFSTTFTYDTKGRLDTRTHPSGIVEKTDYNTYGYFKSISVGSTTYYEVTGMNARQQLTAANYGNMTATFGFDAFGYPQSQDVKDGTVNKQDYRYIFDAVTGNLTRRENAIQSKFETFTYDPSHDRLTGVTGPQNLTMEYFDNGNIKLKTDIHATTNFGYGTNAGPYALTDVTSSNTAIPSASQTATYTSFEKVNTLTEGVYSAAFIYNSDRQRAKMDVTQSGSNILTRWYAGSSYMKETAGGITKQYTYLGGDAYSAPVVAVKEGTNDPVYYYLLRDYLGNITHQVNTSNTVVAEYNFDAWGRRRSADDWSYTLDGNDLALFADRGFTGHETLPWFNLVNMNGRLYDPLVGRFLSADPYVQMPDYTQNYNRYSYCLNNPLRYTDPDGESFLAALAIIWAGNYIIGLLDNTINKKMSLKEAFRNTSFIMGANISPNDLSKKNNYGVSNPQVDAQNAVKQQAIAGQKASNEIVGKRAQYMGEWHTSSNGYSRGVISQSGFYNAFTPMENIGIAGGYFYSFYTDTYQGPEGKWYAQTSASAFAPHAEGMSDKLTYFGRTELIVNGNVISSQKFSIPSEYPSLILQPNYTWLGYTNMQLPTISTNAQLRITISYNSYQWWNGNANPLKPYTYIVNY